MRVIILMKLSALLGEDHCRTNDSGGVLVKTKFRGMKEM
jgi:hypothetical protein